jgi:GT2 family glycosyltransferase
MSDYIDFSIIIPTRNRHGQLAACLDATACLRYPPSRFEVVIVDDGSRPSVESVVEPRRRRLAITLCTQSGGGPARARNRGAGIARGRFLAFTDDDCRPAPGWLEELAACLESAPNAIVGGRTVNALEDNVFAVASQGLISYLYDYFNRDPAMPWFLAANNIALEAKRFHSAGGFDPAFPTAAAEDRDLCERLRDCGSPMVYASAAVVYHLHPLTLRTFWRQHFGYGRGALRFRRAHSARAGQDIRIEPLRFYAGIQAWPSRQKHVRHPPALSALLLLSQVANAAGFFWEWAFARACAPEPRETTVETIRTAK